MLISKVPDNDGGRGEGHEITEDNNDSHEYQTANELFELMAKNQKFDTGDVETLTTRDLVLLYKNIDLGTKLMSNANELKRKKPNQHVENIVYNDEPESDSSDVSEIYSNEDMHNVFLINNERLDLLNTPSSVENTLCHKLGDLEIQSSDLTTEYDKHFLFKDPYIKDQLTSLKLTTNEIEFEGTLLPASLLDYICCKRLEDNYNFYMENIIRYVKHTIEQLKRISNGDYLTDKAKERWREVENVTEDPRHANTKVLATSTSIPLHVERKIGGRKSTWDDIVHSAVDIRSLSKILEKKIVVEVPKLICGSYKLLSKCCADNLIISCKKDKRPVDDASEESRVDVVFQLQRSETGQVISNISSIMILQTKPAHCDTHEIDLPLPLPVTYQELTTNSNPDEKVKIIELEQIETDKISKGSSIDSDYGDRAKEDTFLDSIDYACSDNDGTASLKNSSYQESSESSDALRDILERKLITSSKLEVSTDIMFPDDLRMTIQKLTMQSALTEESGEDMSQSTTIKRKSPPRVRIKSPYENQSHIMEEKKRRKLLEIRERRERKKMALAENCKIIKHKYTKGAVMPQSASSVTKLSISNKSFYNSIYGQSSNVEPKQTKGKNRKGRRDILDVALVGLDEEHDMSITSEKNSKKYINRSYYLDDAVTEMMYMNMKQNENEGKDLCSTSTSVISNDFRNNLNLLSQLIAPSEIELNIVGHEIVADDKTEPVSATTPVEDNDGDSTKRLALSKSTLNIVPSNSPNEEDRERNDSKKVISTVECRKSIDKIYNLMKKFGKVQDTESKSSKSKSVANNTEKNDDNRESSTFQGSDSGTSLKHHLTSSNPSCFSFDKNQTEVLKSNNTYNQIPGSPNTVVPKVIISSKSSSQTHKTDSDKSKKERRRSVTSPISKVSENPLKAISQLLHEFENVQKNRQKPATEQKTPKKPEHVISDGKSGARQSTFKRRSRLDQHNEAQTERYNRVTTPKDKKRTFTAMDIPKIPYQQIPPDDKHVDKISKKKITDILDEAKEARGEAVRGPSKLNSRLNSLAQPKRSYVQAHSEEYQIKYGKTIMADRLQKLAAAPPASASERHLGSANSRKVKRNGTEAVSAVSMKLPPPPVPPLERAARTRHSTSSSPEAKDRLGQGVGPSYKQLNVPETPETLKKKMVAVESYVKNHYGRATSTTVINEHQSVQKSRVPLVPNDIELASSSSSPTAEESTELGSRLHHIINTMINTTSQGLEVLAEGHESNSRLTKDNTDDYSLAENLSRSEQVSSDSEYTIDILDDKHVITTVETNKASNKEQCKIKVEEASTTRYGLQPFKSVTELEKLEHALCRHISVGTFPKRLRIKNLTLTPKHSMQQVYLLQSGDAGSLFVKTPMPQKFNDTKPNNFPDLKTLPILTKTHLDWSFTNFPMQISTVGYAIPEYKLIQCASTSPVKIYNEVSKSTVEQFHDKCSLKSDKDMQCFKGRHPQNQSEQAAQVDVPVLVSIGISSTHIMDHEKDKDVKQCNESNTELKHVFIDFSEHETVEEGPNSVRTEINDINKKKESCLAAGNLDDIEYTTSLDILVGLLSEIQKITTCQTQMTNSDKHRDQNQENLELEIILNNAAALENSIKSSPCDVVSFSSLDRLRQLESNQSVYSFYLSDNEGSERDSSKMNFPSEIIPLNTDNLLYPKPIHVDKEVSVDFGEREYVNRFTDVPSHVFPIGMNHSTNMTNSLIGVLSEPSTQSMFSFAEYHSVYSNASSFINKNIIEIPQIVLTRESSQSVAICNANKTIEKIDENKLYKKKIQPPGKDRNKKNENVTKCKYRLTSDFDPIMKMKRDILVTVYSILVFTIFAALSFPEMFFHV